MVFFSLVASKIKYAQTFIFKSCQKQTVNFWVLGVFQKRKKEKQRKKERERKSEQNSQAEVTEDFESVRKAILSFG